jgi:hypothetical protein
MQKLVFSNDTGIMNEATSSNVLQDKTNPNNTPPNVLPDETSAENTAPEIPSVKELTQNERMIAPPDISKFLKSLSPLYVIIMAICAVIVLYLIILMTVALICMRRRKDVLTAGRYSCNTAQQYQGEKRGEDKSEQSAADLEVGLSLSSGISSSSPRSLDTVTTTSDRESLGHRKLHFQEDDQNKSVPLNFSSFDESDPDLIFSSGDQ